jgi:hypothetical protein
MKISSAGAPADSVTARNCFLVNQFATPGLGSIMGRRFLAGIGQLLLALAGFGLVIAWFSLTLVHAFDSAGADGGSPPPLASHLGEAGGLLFVISWFWSLATSLSLLRDARKSGRPGFESVPPLISDSTSRKP